MTNLSAANFRLTVGDGVTKRRFRDRLEDEWISVMEFGADPTGAADSTASIQAAINFAYGTYADPHGYYHWGDGFDIFLNRIVFFPPGDYKVSSTLAVNKGRGPVLRGAGQYQTRIFWDPTAPEHVAPETANYPAAGANISSLIEFRTCWYVVVEGITLDAGGVQQVAMRSVSFNGGDDGSGGYYRDVLFTNGTIDGFLAAGAAMGSERTFVNCGFTNCQNGHMLVSGNALNHSFYNCYFADCEVGARQNIGGSGTLFFCRFENNSAWDIDHAQSQLRVVGCHSTSQNFASADGIFVSNTHDAATSGLFWSPEAIQGGAFKANYSSKGKFSTAGGAVGLSLVGNVFDDPDYLDGVTLPVWIDGVAA